MIKGKRVRFFYKSMEEAETKAALMRVKRQNEGQVGFDLPVSDRLDAIECLALLRPHGLTLRQAVEFCLKNLNIINCTKTVPEVVNELLIAKEQDGRSKPYLRDLKARLGVFERTINERPIHDVNAHEIDSFLRSLPGGPVNRNNYRRVLGILYSFAVEQRYTLKNPVREVAIANVEVTKPGILTVPEARAMLDAATPDFLPVIALGLFAGLRPESEIWRLAWSNIDFEDRVIDVQKSKNVASHRFVRIPDNLLAWLKPYANKKGQVSKRNDAFFRRMRATRAGAVTALGE